MKSYRNDLCNFNKYKGKERERAGALVEFAIIFPIIMLLLFGVVEFGRVMMVQNMVTSAAREGSRVAILPGGNNAAVNTRVTNVLASAGLEPDRIVTDPEDVSTAEGNTPITITVTVDFNDYSLVRGFFDSMMLTGQVTMRKEGF